MICNILTDSQKIKILMEAGYTVKPVAISDKDVIYMIDSKEKIKEGMGKELFSLSDSRIPRVSISNLGDIRFDFTKNSYVEGYDRCLDEYNIPNETEFELNFIVENYKTLKHKIKLQGKMTPPKEENGTTVIGNICLIAETMSGKPKNEMLQYEQGLKGAKIYNSVIHDANETKTLSLDKCYPDNIKDYFQEFLLDLKLELFPWEWEDHKMFAYIQSCLEIYIEELMKHFNREVSETNAKKR